MIKVEDMMTRNPHTLLRNHTIADARNMMKALDIRHIPIVDANRRLLGIVTHRDVLSAQESSLYHQVASTPHTEVTPLFEVMHTGVMTVSPQAGLKQSALYMQKHKVGCLPVVNKGELVGIITDTDFVAIAINLLELQENSEPDEVETDDSFDPKSL